MWSALCIDGSATFTTVLSSMIMKSPNETAASVHHLRFSGVKRRAFTNVSPCLASTKLVHTRLASTNRSGQTTTLRAGQPCGEARGADGNRDAGVATPSLGAQELVLARASKDPGAASVAHSHDR